jgi:hypothetical protein
MNGLQISWPDAAGVTYDLMSASNLVSGVWETNVADVAGSPMDLPTSAEEAYFRVDVKVQP